MKKLGNTERELGQKDATAKGDSAKEGQTAAVGHAVEELLPQIAAESKSRGERIRRVSFTRKPGLTKKDIIVDTVPFAGCFTGSASAPPPLPNTPDDYEKEIAGFRPAASVLAEVA
jgi:hypothetical protein